MKNLSRNLFIVLALLALLTLNLQLSTLHAQGTAFTYQGRLNDSGSRANGNYDLEFTLFDDATTNGNQIGDTVTNLAVSVNNGLFTTTIDFGPGIFTGNPLWLQIGIETNGSSGNFTMLSALQPLTPMPYAIYSPNAGTADTASTAGSVANGSITSGSIASGQVVKSVNGLEDAITLAAGANVTIIPTGNTLTIKSAGSGGPGSGWSLTGNAATMAGTNFLGTTDNQPLELHVNGMRVLRLEEDDSGDGEPDVIGGSQVNFVPFGVYGATISGGGSAYSYYYGSGPGFGGPTSNSVTAPEFGTVSGGTGNSAAADLATVGGGYLNTAGGAYATVPGGIRNTAAGTSSFAAGQGAQANHQGAFVWADSQNGYFSSTGNNQFCVRAGGGVQLDPTTSLFCGSQTRQMLNLYSSTYGIGVQNSDMYFRTGGEVFWYNGGSHNDAFGNAGGGSQLMRLGSTGNLIVTGSVTAQGVVLTSDRNAKEHFQAVDTQNVLEKVAALPMSEWQFKTAPDGRHLGPMAQDFRAAFGLGADDKHIAVVDEGGVALAAIQGLNEKLNEKDAEIQTLTQQNDSLAERLSDLEAAVKQLAAQK